MNASSPAAGVYAREAQAQVRSTLRSRQFLVPSILLPIGFYGLFGVAFAKGHPEVAQWLFATYAVFAAIGPSMFGFGATVAAEREAGLVALKRVSPMPPGAWVASKLVASLAVTAAALAGITALAVGAGVSMPLWRWLAVLALGAGSSIPFALIGLNIGLRISAQGASAAAQAVFLTFSALGGLWVPLSQAPPWLTTIAWALPSFHLGQLALALAGATAARDTFAHVAVIVVITAAAGVGALIAWRRDEA